MPDVLVIGFGNPLRSDDGLGWRAAQELDHADLGDDVRVLACHQLVPEHAADVAAAGCVLFIDAACDLPAGRVACERVEGADETRPSFCMHRLDPRGVLALARDVYGACPPAIVLSAGVESFECGDQMTHAATTALAEAVARAREIIADRLRPAACP